ncbi:putative reverse transcriptase domain-containing protein [Tanacetum coccineum]
MTTRSAGRETAAPRGGRTSGRTGRGSGRTRGQFSDQGNSGINGQGGQVGGQGNQGSNLGNGRSQNGDAVNENIRGDVRNVIENDDHRGCTYKEFLACNTKEYDGKGGAIVYTRWIEKMESVQDMSGCRDNQKVKYTVRSFVGMSWEDFKTLTMEEFCPVNEMQKLETEFWNHVMVGAGHAAYTDRFHELARLAPHLLATIQKAVQKAGTLTDEAIRNGSQKKNLKKRGNNRESSRDRNVRDDNKRNRTGNAFAITTNPDYRVAPRMLNPVNAKNPTAAPGACYECGRTDHLKAACPRLNQAQRLGGNHPNQVVVNNGGQGYGNNGNQARRRAFLLGAEEARQDPNILVEIDKVIKGCKLEIKGHMFDINLIPFGSGSFDVIIGMDWLSNHKAEIICHEKVVRIPLPDGKVLRVIGERPEEKIRNVMSAKANEQKQEEIVVVRDFIELVPEAISVAKYPYRLAPSEMEELSGQLKEL